MNAWETIQQSIDMIECHMSEDLPIERLAKQACLSPFYYQRLFQRLCGYRVHEYIKGRRLSKAVYVIKKGTTSMLDVALDCGFQSHEAFSKAFKDTFQMTPSTYQKTKVTLNVMPRVDLQLKASKLALKECYIAQDMMLEISKETLLEDLIFCGKSKQGNTKDMQKMQVNPLVELWKDICEDADYAMDMLTPGDSEETYTYFVGVEQGCQHTGDETRTMPKGTYIVCRYEAETFEQLVQEALYKASGYLYEMWLPENGYQPEPILVQKYFRPSSTDCWMELWAKVSEAV